MSESSYDASALDVALNEIRFRLGDTGPDFRLSDAEIEAYAPGGVLEKSSNTAACLALLDGLIARYSGVVDVSEGGASFSGSQLAAQFRLRKAEIQRQVLSGASVASGMFTGTVINPSFTRIAGDTEWPAAVPDGTYE